MCEKKKSHDQPPLGPAFYLCEGFNKQASEQEPKYSAASRSELKLNSSPSECTAGLTTGLDSTKGVFGHSRLCFPASVFEKGLA